MSLALKKIEDSRDEIGQMRRYPLVQFAHDIGHKDISEMMEVGFIRRLLKERGVSRHQAREWMAKQRMRLPPLGTVNPSAYEKGQFSPAMAPPADAKIENVTAEEDMARRWQAQKQAERKDTRPPSEITTLRMECKKRGIKMARTDNIKTLREKLGQDPS